LSCAYNLISRVNGSSVIVFLPPYLLGINKDLKLEGIMMSIFPKIWVLTEPCPPRPVICIHFWKRCLNLFFVIPEEFDSQQQQQHM
jgi:hypothetical protein